MRSVALQRFELFRWTFERSTKFERNRYGSAAVARRQRLLGRPDCGDDETAEFRWLRRVPVLLRTQIRNVRLRSEYLQKLAFVVGEIALHYVHAWSQQSFECANVQNCRKKSIIDQKVARLSNLANPDSLDNPIYWSTRWSAFQLQNIQFENV